MRLINKIKRKVNKSSRFLTFYMAIMSMLMNMLTPFLLSYSYVAHAQDISAPAAEEVKVDEPKEEVKDSSKEEVKVEEPAPAEEPQASEEVVEAAPEENPIVEEAAPVVENPVEEPAIEPVVEPVAESSASEPQGDILPDGASDYRPEEGAVEPTSEPTTATTDAADPVVAASEPAKVIEQECLTDGQAISDTTKEEWNIDSENGIAQTKEKVKLGVKYIFPEDEKVTVTFSCLPKNEEDKSVLKIQKVKVEDLKLPDGVQTSAEFAYDITTEMKNESFKYDLELPKPEGAEAKVSYIEKSLEEATSEEVKAEDVKNVEKKDIEQKSEDSDFKVNDLDHFTIFVIYVSNLQPNYSAPGGGGVFSAYVGPPAYQLDYQSPGVTTTYDGREAGIIKAGLNIDPDDGHYWDEGLFAFKPTVTIDGFAGGEVSYDVDTQYGENPVWMTIEIDTGVVGDRSDNTVYQHVPTSNPAGWHTVNAGAGLWQKWNNNQGDVTGNPLITLNQVASDNTGLDVARAYLRLGMGDTYHGNAGLGTVAWVDKATFGGETYDFIIDTDSDGISDSQDNCPAVANADQTDDDHDGIGNVCDAPTLKLVKVVSGGASTAHDWSLSAQGFAGGFTDFGDSTDFHNVQANVSYALSEMGPTGYSPLDWTCDNGITVSNASITLPLAKNVTCSITNTTQTACITPPSNMISWWPGDENANDIKGTNNGIFVNGGSIVSGKVGGAFNFQNAPNAPVGQHVAISSPVGLPVGNSPRTVDLWFKTASNLSSNTESALFEYGTPANGQMFALVTSMNVPGRLYFYGHNADVSGGSVLQPDTWYHGAVTYDGTTIKLYLNGQLENYGAIGLNTVLDNNGFTIGNRPGSAVWNGQIDEVEIFDRALSQSEIAAIYNAGSFGKCKPQASDRDSDGIPDATDNCPAVPNPGQIDTDADGIGDVCDNCADVANPDQSDTNLNGIGDVCEGEYNCNDGIDNDGNGSTDCADSFCANNPVCQSSAVCNDGIVNQPSEQCDYGQLNGQSSCSSTCKWVSECTSEKIANGSFEIPTVVNGEKWDIFGNGEVSGWIAEWLPGSGGGNNPQIELQAGVNGWTSSDDQYVELDTDWDGPGGPLNGEAASISLYQDIPTVPGYEYKLTFDYSARPNHDNNRIEVKVDSDPVFDSGVIAGGGSINWQTKEHTFTATGTVTRIRFTELGTPDSYGMFLDDVKVACLGSNVVPVCGDGIVNQPTEQCDGTDGVTAGQNSCSTTCQLIPLYNGGNSCPAGTTEKLLGSYNIDSTDSDGETLSLTNGNNYLFKVSQTFLPTGAPGYLSDAGYTLVDNVLSGQYGINGTGEDYAAHALLGDLGSGVGVINWGSYNGSHEYAFYGQVNTASPQFLIGDRYGTWFNTPYQNQSGMNDNNGSLKLDVYECNATPVTLKAQKVVCDSEIYLPNWGNHGATIDGTTAQNYVDTKNAEIGREVCRLEPQWAFQWGPAGAGTFDSFQTSTGLLGAPWNTFNAVDTVEISDVNSLGGRIEVRELIPTNSGTFRGFSGDDSNNVSAEFYCSGDVSHYDNWEWINNPQRGQTYYCVGFNSKEVGKVIGAKYNDLNGSGQRDNVGDTQNTEPGLSGWTIKLENIAGAIVNTTTTDEKGDYWFNYIPAGNYKVCEVPQTGWTNTDPSDGSYCKDVTVVGGQEVSADFGNRQTSTVTVCKSDTGQTKLGGWRVYLTGGILESFAVPSNGSRVTKNYPTDNYAVLASGIYNYGDERMIADAANSFRYSSLPCSEGVDSWVNGDASACLNHYLNLNPSTSVGPTNAGWGDSYNPIHVYAKPFTGGELNFKIWDSCSTTGEGCYGDNEGGLNIGVYKGFVGDTEGNGCVTFENVPYGTYQMGETMKNGWENISGLNEVVIDTPVENFDIVNRQLPTKGNLSICKYNDLNKNGAIDENEPEIWWEMTVVDKGTGNIWGTATSAGQCLTLDGMNLGTYEVTEKQVSGWTTSFPTGSGPQTVTLDVNNPDVTVNFLNYETPVVKIVASKVVCANEEDLPNWGYGAPNNITAITAQRWISTHPSCHLEDGWQFQWGNDSVTNPGDATLGEAAGWTTFGPTVSGTATADIYDFGSTAQIKVREVLQSGYLPFTFITNGSTNVDNVSAEIYCSDDVLNYDNDDRITGPQYGQTYYCVAFNALNYGEITVDKITNPSGDLTPFTFNLNEVGTKATGIEFSLSDVDTPYVNSQLLAGTYSLSEVVSDGWMNESWSCTKNGNETITDNQNIVVNPGDSILCEFRNAKLGSIHGYKWNDYDGDGAKGINEVLLPGWTINLYKWNGTGYDSNPVAAMNTDSNDQHLGWYWFENLLPGQYKVCEVLQGGWNQTFPMTTNGNCHVISLPSGNSNGFEFPGMVNAIDGPVYSFGNQQLGTINVTKFNDADGSGTKDGSEGVLGDWTINLSNGLNAVTDQNGHVAFGNLAPNVDYVLSETMKEGWYQTGITCEVEQSGQGELITASGEAYGHHGQCSGWNGCGDAATCAQWACEVKGYDHVVSYGAEKPCTQFNNCNLFSSRGNVQMNWGNWCPVMGVTDIKCSSTSGSDVSSVSQASVENFEVVDNSKHITVNPGDVWNCSIGNRMVNPVLHITKENDTGGIGQNIGDLIKYKIMVWVTEFGLKDVKVKDLLPKGFKYVGGSWTAFNSDGNLPVPEPVYASPGTWNIGDLEVGKPVTLEYTAEIQNEVDAGLYKDLAWTAGDDILSNNVLGLADPTGYVATNFVGTQVLVDVGNTPEKAKAKTNTTEKITEEVLGASDVRLPGTGISASIIQTLLATFALGGLLLILGGVSKLMKKRKGVLSILAILMFGILSIGQAKAESSNLFVRLEKPEPTAIAPFKITYVVMDLVGNRDITVKCYVDVPSNHDFQTDVIHTSGGDTGTCDVTDAILDDGGNYNFYVNASADGPSDSMDSETFTVAYDSKGPGKPQYIEKDKKSDCKNEITLKTANDGGETSYVEVYRSEDKEFTVDDGNKIQTISLGSDTKYTFSDEFAGGDCGKKFYYAVRAFDSSGNASNVRSEEITTNTTKTIEGETTTTEETGALLAGGQVLGTGESGTGGEKVVLEGASGEQGSILGQETSGSAQAEAGEFVEAITSKWWLWVGALVIISAIVNAIRKKGSRK